MDAAVLRPAFRRVVVGDRIALPEPRRVDDAAERNVVLREVGDDGVGATRGEQLIQRHAARVVRVAGDLEEQVFRLKIQKSMGQGEAGNKIRPLRRELARLKTVLSEKGGKS